MKKLHASTLGRLAILFILTLFVGCAGSGLSSMTPRERTLFDEAMRENTTPGEMISQAEKRLEKATEAQLDFYAPHTLQAATELVKKANALLVKKGEKPEKVLLVAIKAKQTIDAGFETKTQVVELLGISLAEKKRLDDLDTPALFPLEYEASLASLKQMITLIEEKKPEEATGLQTQFTQQTAALLIKTLDKITLDEARKILAQAQAQEAKRYAPATFETATLKLTQAETFIRTYPRDKDGIKSIKKETLKAATHALMITREVKMINALETSTVERFALSIEKQIRKVGNSLGQPDMPYHTLQTQLEGLIQSAETLSATAAKVPGLEETKETLGSALDAEKKSAETLKQQITGLEDSLAVLTAGKVQDDQAKVELTQANTELKTQIETLNQNLTAKQEAGEKISGEKTMALEEITQLKRTLTELEMKLGDTEKKLTQAEALKTEIQTLEEANRECEEKITGLQSDKNRGLDEIAALKDTVSELKQTLEGKKAALKQAEESEEKAADQAATALNS
ncbi:hypothetical protein [Desulfoluna sp.]|uniref:hypothetical protein n=1 Tax=Desulfoluna sp. TaxID=2045199 RepID=UPI00261C0D4A|nr:hypothetical protein [Desulfoluna sp.]